MQSCPLIRFILILGAVLFASCSGSGSSSGDQFRNIRCGSTGQASFCLAACNLGCSTTGCGVTEVAQNQPITLVFSQPVDPASVNSATVSIQTANGEPPLGTRVVQGNTVQFLPEASIQGGVNVFGFRRNETYILNLPGGPGNGNTLRSASGEPLGNTVTCPLNVTHGPIDLNGQPPTPTLVSPAALTGVDLDVAIVVEFDEPLDATVFRGVTSATSPIAYRLRRTRPSSVNPLLRECDPNSAPLTLEGTPRLSIDPVTGVSRVTMKPNIVLPSEICVEVDVTTRVRDVAGVASRPHLYQFMTRSSSQVERVISEGFGSGAQLDVDSSSGTWGNGSAVAGVLGGDGRHGEFDVTDGVASGTTYTWNSDSQRISKPLVGGSVTVTDGTFYFTNFKLAAGSTLQFAGSKPVKIYVRGKVDISGVINSTPPAQVGHIGSVVTGQPGSPGVLGGGTGGAGADKADGVAAQARFSGQPGQDVRLVAGHSYSGRAAGTGGRGSPQEPASGRNADATALFSGWVAHITAGGGGGGFLTAGEQGTAIDNGVVPPRGLGGPGAGGSAFDLFPVPPSTSGTFNLEHFLVGGSGGGGAGSHPFFSFTTPYTWKSGGGGAGGGGALAFRAGRDITMTGQLQVLGGATPGNGVGAIGPAGNGGGGSGGSIILQLGGQPSLGGTISVMGGTGGRTNDGTFRVHTKAGDGAPGFIRLELAGGGNPGLLGTTQPPATADNVGNLTDVDAIVGAQSRWYASRLVFPPEWLRYEIDAVVDSVPVRYSDDPALSLPRADVGQPVRFMIQGARVNATTNEPETATIRPWRKQVGPHISSEPSLSGDDATGFRFLLTFDRTSTTDVVVKRVQIFYRG